MRVFVTYRMIGGRMCVDDVFATKELARRRVQSTAKVLSQVDCFDVQMTERTAEEDVRQMQLLERAAGKEQPAAQPKEDHGSNISGLDEEVNK